MQSRDKMYFYDKFASEFDAKMNMYDTNKRMRIIFSQMLKNENLVGKELLDAGSGTGWFSQKACERGANVTSLDVGDNILQEVRKKCNSRLVKGDICSTEFDNCIFDYIICTEVIEHTQNPRKVVEEMHRILKKGGSLVLTTPNKLWYFSIVIANVLNLRPYEGYENWVGWFQLKKWLNEIGFDIKEMLGFHVLPFVFSPLYDIIDYFDRYGKQIGPIMLNMAVKAQKLNDMCVFASGVEE